MTNTQDKLKVSISNLLYLILEIIAILVLLGGIIPLFFSETKMSFFSNILDPVIFIPAIITADQTIGKKIKILALMGYSLVSIIIICFFYEHLRDYELNLKVMIYFWYISLFYVLQRHIKREKILPVILYIPLVLLILINSFMYFYYIPCDKRHLEAEIEKQQLILDRMKLLHSNIQYVFDCQQKLNYNRGLNSNETKTDLVQQSKELMRKFDKKSYNKYLEFEKIIQKLQKDKNNTSVSELEKFSGLYYSNCQEAKVEYENLHKHIVRSNYEYNRFLKHPIWNKQYEDINKGDVISPHGFSSQNILSISDFIKRSYSPQKFFYKDIEIYDNHYIFEWCTPINVFAKELLEGKSSFAEQQQKLLNEYKIKMKNWKDEKNKSIQSLRNMSYEEIKNKYRLRYFQKDMINNIAEMEACKH